MPGIPLCPIKLYLGENFHAHLVDQTESTKQGSETPRKMEGEQHGTG